MFGGHGEGVGAGGGRRGSAGDGVVTYFNENHDDLYNNSRLFIVPLLSGAGIKGKILDSMAFGVPVIGTDLAFEGTGLTNGLSCTVCSSPDEWVN